MPFAAIAPIVAVAAAAAGTAMSMKAASDSKQAMQDQMDKQMAAQKKYQEQANAAAARSLQQGGPDVAKKQIEQGTQNLENAYKAITSVPVTQPGQQNAPTTSMVADKGTNAQNAMSNQARAALGGYNEWTLDQWIKDLRANQQLGLASSQAKLTAAGLPQQLWHAQQSGQDLATAGQLTSAAGNLAGAYGVNQPGGLFGAYNNTGGSRSPLTKEQIALGYTAPDYNPGQIQY